MAKARAEEVEQTIDERPADELAGLALRAAVERFNAGILSRETMTDADQYALDDIEVLHNAFQSSALAEWGSSSKVPESVQSLNMLVRDYAIAANDRTQDTYASGRTSSWPAIRNADYRREFAGEGAQLLEVIDTAVNASRFREAGKVAKKEAQRAAVRFWLSRPETRAYLAAIVERADSRDPHSRPPGALMDLRGAMQRHNIAEEQAGRPAPDQLYSHEWREWLPAVREAIAEEQ